MAQMITCSGTLSVGQVAAGGRPGGWISDTALIFIPRCSGDWEFVEYVPPVTPPAPVVSSSYMVCTGDIDPVALTCSTGWAASPHVPPFDTSQIDPTVVAALFGGGFVLYITPWAIAWGASQLLRLIR